MPKQDEEDSTNAGDAVMKAVGGLNAATAELKLQVARKSDVNGDDVVSVLKTIGYAILKIFGKE